MSNREGVIQFRTAKETKQLLEKAGRKSSRTLSRECDHHVERSLIDWGDGPAHALMSLCARVINDVAGVRGTSRWWVDAYQFEIARAGVIEMLDMFRPPGKVPNILPEDAKRIRFARESLVRDILLADLQASPSAYGKWARAARRELGSLAAGQITFGMSSADLVDHVTLVAPFRDELVRLSKLSGDKRRSMTGAQKARLEELRLKAWNTLNASQKKNMTETLRKAEAESRDCLMAEYDRATLKERKRLEKIFPEVFSKAQQA